MIGMGLLDGMLGLRPFGAALAGAGGAAPRDDDASVYIAAMSTEPDATRVDLIHQLFIDLKDAGVYALLDEAWLLASHTAQAGLLGLKRNHDCTNVNSAAFEVDRGYTGNGTTSYLNTNFVPSTDGVNFVQNNASFGVYSRTNNTGSVSDIGGNAASDTLFCTIAARLATNVTLSRVNHGAAGSLSASNLNSSGLILARRTASNVQESWRNGALLGSNGTGSTGVTPVALFVCARNANGTAVELTTRQYAFSFVAASMSTTQQEDFYTIIQAYMTAIGANV